MHINFVDKTLSFRKHFDTILTEERRIAKFNDQTKYTWITLLGVFTPCNRFKNLTNIAELLWCGKNSSFCTSTCNEALYSVILFSSALYIFSLWTIHNGVFDKPTVCIPTWSRFTASVLTIHCIQRQYWSF